MIFCGIIPHAPHRHAVVNVALIFDSQYDSYRGAIVYLRVVNGTVYPGMDIRMMASGAVYKVVEVGYLHPKGMIPAESLGAGEVGYLTASIKTAHR